MNKIAERRRGILRLLHERGSITVSDIMTQFGVSEATARRDLEVLEQERKLIRTFGGAILDTVRTEIPFYRKMEMNTAEKLRIAEKAYGLIRDGDVIGLSGGTTTLFLARRIARDPFSRLTVVTNALNIGFELAGIPGLELVLTGGVNRTQSYELSGPIADAMLEKISIQKAFIGADGVDPTLGLTTHNELEANTNRIMIRQSKETYVLADHSKMNRRSLFWIEGWHNITSLITDDGISPETKRLFAAAGIHVI